jgi:hypothetical protein
LWELKIPKYRLSSAGAYDPNPPPVWYKLCCVPDMPFAHNECHAIANSTVSLDLFTKTAKAVVIAFELKAMQYTIYQRNINSCPPPSDAELVNDFSVGLAAILLAEIIPEDTTNVVIMHGEVRNSNHTGRRAALQFCDELCVDGGKLEIA